MERKSKGGRGFKMKGHALPGINQRSETKNMADGRSKSSAFQQNEEFPGLVDFEVDVEGKDTKRDILAKQAKTSKSGIVKPNMEQSARTQDYKKADELLASQGDEGAKKRLRNLASRTTEVKELFAQNPDMSQAEIDKLMSQR